jgi:hypothetical protein
MKKKKNLIDVSGWSMRKFNRFMNKIMGTTKHRKVSKDGK